MANVSAIPAAIDGLVALADGATDAGGALDGVLVLDGPDVGNLAEQLLLFIGDDPEGEQDSAQGTQEFAALGASRRDEVFAITCTAVARSGDTDPQAVRAERVRAFAIMGGVERLLRPGALPASDIRLGGAVQWAHVGGDIILSQRQTPEGALVKLQFAVVCRARI